MAAKLPGDEVAVGLLAGPDDFERVRIGIREGIMAQFWRRLVEEASVEQDILGPLRLAGELAFAAAVTRRNDLAEKAREAALGMARRPHWMQAEAGCIGLHGMHVALELCLAVDWLWPVLSTDDRAMLLGAVIAKGIENLSSSPPGVRDPRDGKGQLLIARRLDIGDSHCLHPITVQVNNWDFLFAATLYMAAALADRAWCSPADGDAALSWGHVYDAGYDLDAGRVARWKEIAVERVTTGISAQLGEDGDYAEGNSYVSMGCRGMMMTLTALERVDGRNLWPAALRRLPQWLRNQYVADLDFGVTNYNDSRLRLQNSCGFLLAWLAHRTGDAETWDFALRAAGACRGRATAVTLLSLEPDAPRRPTKLPLAAWYRHTGQVIWRTAQDRSGVFFSIKSGAHGGAHQHNDRNSLFLSAHGEHMVVDSGDGRYADPPSDPPFDQTEAHSALLIDGQGQIGNNRAPVAGRILEHHHEGDWSTALADAGGCYAAAGACRRRVVFARPDLLIVSDRVEASCERLTWLLQGYNADGAGRWVCGDRQAVFERPLARLYVAFLEPVVDLRVGVGTLDGEQRAILRFEADVQGRLVTAVLVPVRKDKPDPTWERGGRAELKICIGGKTHCLTATAGEVTVNGRSFLR